MNDRIYLDHSATTPLDAVVAEAMRAWQEQPANASSAHAEGRTARVALEEAREQIAGTINAHPSEIVFTSGGTEANNAAIVGAYLKHLVDGHAPNEFALITSSAEHHSVLEPASLLRKLGACVFECSPNTEGIIEKSRVSADVATTSARTTLVSMMSVNNETGSINPIREIVAACSSKNALIHTDAVQALGKVPIDVLELGVDLASFSAHKLNGPHGIGALYIRSGVLIEPLLRGGAQERNRRGGTESIALAVGFAKACELASARMKSGVDRAAELGRMLRARLESMPTIEINSPLDHCLASIVSFTFVEPVRKKIDGETLIMQFDLRGIAVSNGAACTSGTQQPSHVLLAMGKPEDVAAASVRVSIGHETTEREIEYFIHVLEEIIRDC